jgi:hypothetical protein
MIPIFYGTVIRGKFVPDNPFMTEYVKTLEGKEVCVVIKPLPKKPSANLHRYYRGVLIKKLCAYTGYKPKEMHALLAELFLVDYDSDGIPYIKSTAKITMKEFLEFLENVKDYGQEAGCPLPEPNEVDYV